MCGIVGIINLVPGPPIHPLLLRSMAASMAHRGPDGEGVWVQEDGQVGLAHRRLAILDLSEAGKQPMSTADGTLWITFNGEIYNFPQLRRELEAKGHRFRSRTDTEVILYLYREYGPEFYTRLDGDFALGLWDTQAKKLVLARDQAGVKPLYYAQHDGKLLFASEIKALLRYPGFAPEIDEDALYHYLTYLVVPAPHTLLAGVYKLPAASAMVLDMANPGPLTARKYWEPFPAVPATAQDFQALDAELESLFAASVEKRMLSDVPVGVLFSGGVDSTLNLCTFEKHSKEPVKTFTVGMRDAGNFHDDSAIARGMAKQLGSDHHEIIISEQDVLDTALKLAQLQDEPVSDPVTVPLYFVTKLAREHGVTVLQAGEGADELFCGYDNYRRFLRYGRYWQWLHALPRGLGGGLGALAAQSSHPLAGKLGDILCRYGKGQELFMSSAVAYYEQEKRSVLSADFLRRKKGLDSFSAVAPFYERLRQQAPGATLLQTITFIELQLRLPELLLMRADKMAMANSIEIRVPFLDRDLMNFALRIPDAYKLRDGISKEPVKRLAARYVAREDVYRPKTGFGLPIKQWFHGELGKQLEDTLEHNREFASRYFNTAAITGKKPRTTNEAFKLWVIFNLLQWRESLMQPQSA